MGAVGSALWHIGNMLTAKTDPCEGCELKAHCKKKKKNLPCE